MSVVIDPPGLPELAPPTGDGAGLWEQLYEALGFHRDGDAENGDALRRFCEAWCAPLQPLYDLVRERDDGTAPWGILLDPERCPAESLPYLAQYVGVVITTEMNEEQIRNEITQPTGWRRGQTESIRIATRRTLKPIGEEELLVIVRPRTPEAGRHYVRTLLSQTPEPARTKAVIRAAVPAWEVLDYEAITGVTVTDVASSTKWTTVADLAAAWPTVQNLSEILPTEI
ncbi:MAG TPA: phage tail protein [Solirubrobacterales bacterium]|nr:phage tail protein [Solirubrobacterales bacterium]